MTNERRPINLFEYHDLAAARLSDMAYGYYVGGAEDEVTLRRNREDFDRLSLRPRVLVDVSELDASAEILGFRSSFPVMVAPMAFMKLAHPQGDAAVVEAAAEAGLIATASTLATTSLEEMANAGDQNLWFQLYVYKDRQVSGDLVQRAEAAGYRALVVTVDVPAQGKRERDVRNRFRLPGDLEPVNLLPYMEQMPQDDGGGNGGAAYATVPNFDPSLQWSDLEWLCGLTDLPVLVKGILRGDDAELAVQHGAQGVIVSNHGGRQLDTVVSGIEALPEVAAAVGGDALVLMDGGVRRGTHVLKALALGAQGVMVGRPILWGLAVAGRSGVAEVLSILRKEFETAMALCGCPAVSDIGPHLVDRL